MPELVIARHALPEVIIDFRYATANNVTGAPLYPEGTEMQLADYLVDPLLQVSQWLGHQGLRLVIWDAHRDNEVQMRLQDTGADEKYVLDESKHVQDLAVDVTLASLKGDYLDMGTDFDDFSERAHRDAADLSVVQRANRELLEKGMEAAGFVGWPYEWWHYDYEGLQ